MTLGFKVTSYFIAILSALILVMAACHGEEAIPQLKSHVNDYANILSSGDRNALDKRLNNFEKNTKTNPQVVVLIIPTLNGDSIEEYTNRVFHDWKLGHEKNNNGVLTVLAAKEHKMRIEVGYDLEPTLTDSVSSDILAVMKPGLKANNWNKALNDEADKLLPIVASGLTSDDAVVPVTSEKPVQVSSTSSNKGFSLMSLLLFAVVCVIGYFLIRKAVRSANTSDNPNRNLPNDSYRSSYNPKSYTPAPPRPMYPPHIPPAPPVDNSGSVIKGAVAGAGAAIVAEELMKSRSRNSDNDSETVTRRHESKKRDDDDSNSSSWGSSSWGGSSSSDSGSSSSSSSDSGSSWSGGGGGDSGGGGSSDSW